MTLTPPTHERHVHPWAFMVLIIPFGVASGYLTVAIAWQLKQAGATVEQVASIVALSYVPHVWKFAWAPIVDSTLTQKRWYTLATVATALGLAVLGAFPATRAGLATLSVVVVVGMFATTLVGMSTESLMAYSTPEHLKGRASGWFQAGNLGGTGIGGGLGLWLVQRVPQPWIASTIVGALCMLCCLALFVVPTPERSHGGGSVLHNLAEAVRDLWKVIRERAGALALFLCFLPVGAGAASGLWSAVATEWRASGDTVALVTGVITGVISAVGCVVGGWICDRIDRKAAYVLYGLLQAGCAVAMAVCPRTPAMFVLWTLTYAFITGLTYAGYSAFVLEAIGKGAAATKFSMYASLSNFPIMYMTTIDGKAHDRFGSAGMLFTEAGLCVLGAIVFVSVAAAFGWKMNARPGASAPAAPTAALETP